MRILRYVTVGIVLALMLWSAAAFAQVANPSYETADLTDWTAYGYTADAGVSTLPAVKTTGPSGFDVLFPDQGPADGSYVCGFQGWGGNYQGGCYQTFTAPADAGYVLISERSYSINYPNNGGEAVDFGNTVRAALVPGVATDRSAVPVDGWTDGLWGNGWNDIILPVVPGTQYTLFIENHLMMSNCVWSTLWDNVRFAGQVVQITNGPTVTAVTTDSATIEWDTDIPSTSVVQYGTWGPPYPETAEGDAGVTHHVVQLTGLSGGLLYKFVVHSEAEPPILGTTSLEQTLAVVQCPMGNGDFEALNDFGSPTLAPWVKFKGPANDNFDGLITGDGTWLYGLTGHSPMHFAAAGGNYDAKDGCGVFQRICATPGTWYKAQVWIWTQEEGGAPQDSGCQIGIDPDGGIDATASSVQWSSPQITQKWDTGEQLGWKQIGAVAKAGSAGMITIFLRTYQAFDLAWHVTAFDDVTLDTESPTNPIDYQNHIGKAKVLLGEGYPVVFTNKIVTATYTVTTLDEMQVPHMHSYLYIQEDDGSSGIKVDYTDIVPAVTVPVGCRIDVQGTLDTRSGETQITATSLPAPQTTPEPLPKPVVVTNKLVATGSLGVQPALPDYSGLSTAGLRVRIAGKVQAPPAYDPSGVLISYVDDGTQVMNDSPFTLIGQVVPGIKIIYMGGTPVYQDSIVGVTGVAGIEYRPEIGFYPVIHVNLSDTDIQMF